ncbi:MAG: hypothetical protein RL398_559 [Planctomycetota bacterium]|jgi:peptidoglycan/LPS O-acetylase OafA/YrhL
MTQPSGSSERRNTAFEVFRGTVSFGSLDGLRCISILLVVMHHAGAHLAGKSFLRFGYLGVDLFFAISGFLITTLLLREAERNGAICLRNFYMRRVLRIFPLYYAVLGFYAVTVGLMEKDVPTRDAFYENLPYFLTYTSNWFVALDQPRVIFYYAWSLATEEQFYLALPPILALLGKRAAVLVVFGLLVIRGLASAGGLDAVFDPSGVPARIVRSVMPSLVLGVLGAFALHERRSFGWLYAALGRRWVAPTLLVGMFGLMQLNLTHLWVMHPWMACLVLSCVIREDHAAAGVLKTRPMVRVGAVSYGIYLLHMPMRQVVQRILPGWEQTQPLVFFLAVAGLSFLAAELSYRWFESRFLRLRSRFR